MHGTSFNLASQPNGDVLKLLHDLFCFLLVLIALINLNLKLQFYSKASFSLLIILIGLEDFVFIVVEDWQHDDDNDQHEDDEDHEADVAADHSILEHDVVSPPLSAPRPSYNLLLNICPGEDWQLLK